MRQGDFYEYLQEYSITRKQLSDKTGLSCRTLSNWYNDPKRKKALKCLILGSI